MRKNIRVRVEKVRYQNGQEQFFGVTTGFTLAEVNLIVFAARENGLYKESKEVLAQIRKYLKAPRSCNAFDARTPGIYIARGNEVTMVFKGYHGFEVLLTSASLWAYDEEKKNDREDRLRRLNGGILTPTNDVERVRMITDISDKMRQQRHKDQVDYNDYLKNYSVSRLSASQIRSRMSAIVERRNSKIKTDNFMASLRNGVEAVEKPYFTRQPKRTVYVKPPPRPTGKSYDLPIPKITIGQKIRPSFVRSRDFEWHRRQILKAMIDDSRRYAKRSKKNVRLPEHLKTSIRNAMFVIDNCYEIEIAGVTATGMQVSAGRAANQCYVGGGSGWSGIDYCAVLLFRAELPVANKDAQQLAVLATHMVSQHILDYYLMDVPETVEIAEAA